MTFKYSSSKLIIKVTNLAVSTRARGARKMTWLMATVRGREMIGELPALFFNLFQRTGSSSIGTQKGNSALKKCSSCSWVENMLDIYLRTR